MPQGGTYSGAIWVEGEIRDQPYYAEYVNLGVGPARVRLSGDGGSNGINAVVLAADGKTINIYSGASASAIADTLEQLTRE